MPNFNSIGSGVSERQVAKNRHLPLTGDIALTTVYALTCYTVMSCSAVFEQRSRFTAASITIITTDTGETRAPKVGHEISDVINAPSYTYHEE